MISLVALVFAMGGYAVAAPQADKNKEEVILQTASSSPVGNAAFGDSVDIPFTNGTFTQKAGETLVVTAELDYTGPGAQDPPLDSCKGVITVSSDALSEERDGAEGLAQFELVTNGLNVTSSISGVIAAPTSTVHHLTGRFSVGCDGTDAPEDFFTVNSIKLTIIRLN